MATLTPRRKTFYGGLDLVTQSALTALADREYEPDDATDLQELAAKAYLLGFRNAAVLFAPQQKTLIS